MRWILLLLSLPVLAQFTPPSGGGSGCGNPNCAVSGNLTVSGTTSIGAMVTIDPAVGITLTGGKKFVGDGSLLTGLPASGGTVTSVGLAGTANQITVTGASPITGAGSLTLSLPSGLVLPTLGGDVLFSDATYDIGKSGATRPRDLFISRNGTVGGTLTVTGHVTLEGVTSAGASGSGNLLFGPTPTTADALADVTIGASGTTRRALVVQAKATPTASPFVVEQSDGVPFFQIQSDGGMILDQRTGATFSKIAQWKYQGTEQANLDFTGVLATRTGFNGGGGFFSTDISGNVVSLATITGKHFLGNGTSPTVAGNGSSNGSIAGKDAFFKVTVGTGTTTSITVTFGTAYANAPAVVCNAQATTTPINVSTTTTAATLTTALFTAAEVLACTAGGF